MEVERVVTRRRKKSQVIANCELLRKKLSNMSVLMIRGEERDTDISNSFYVIEIFVLQPHHDS